MKTIKFEVTFQVLEGVSPEVLEQARQTAREVLMAAAVLQMPPRQQDLPTHEYNVFKQQFTLQGYEVSRGEVEETL